MAFIKAGPPLHHYRGAGKQLRRSLLLVPLPRGGRLRHEGLLLTSRESCGRTQMSREGFSLFFFCSFTHCWIPQAVLGMYAARAIHRVDATGVALGTGEAPVSTHRTRARGWAHTAHVREGEHTHKSKSAAALIIIMIMRETDLGCLL